MNQNQARTRGWVSIFMAGAVVALFGGCASDGKDADQADAGELDNAVGDECGPEATKRCTDKFGVEMCPADTEFPGDGLRPCASKDAILLHYGPRNYDDPDEVDKYMTDNPDGGNGEFFAVDFAAEYVWAF